MYLTRDNTDHYALWTFKPVYNEAGFWTGRKDKLKYYCTFNIVENTFNKIYPGIRLEKSSMVKIESTCNNGVYLKIGIVERYNQKGQPI